MLIPKEMYDIGPSEEVFLCGRAEKVQIATYGHGYDNEINRFARLLNVMQIKYGVVYLDECAEMLDNPLNEYGRTEANFLLYIGMRCFPFAVINETALSYSELCELLIDLESTYPRGRYAGLTYRGVEDHEKQLNAERFLKMESQWIAGENALSLPYAVIPVKAHSPSYDSIEGDFSGVIVNSDEFPF